MGACPCTLLRCQLYESFPLGKFSGFSIPPSGDKWRQNTCLRSRAGRSNLLQSFFIPKAKTGNLKHLHARQIKHMIKPILLANGIRLPCESSHTKSGFPQHVARPSQNYELAITPLAQLQSPWPDNALMRLWVARSAWRSTLS